MTSLKKQIHFTYPIKSKIAIGLVLCLFLSFVIIVLEPFDTDQFKSDNKLLLLSGFGFLIFIVFVTQSCIENNFYLKTGKVWKVSHEILSTIVFFIFSGTILYFYNRMVINGSAYSINSHLLYMLTIVIAMIPIFAPLMIYLRQKFGEKIVPLSPNSFILTGENRNENLTLEKEELLFIKAVENYIEICFLDKSKKVVSKTFRQTLSNVCEQLPFLEKCHRSYLVNLSSIKEINGNSQSATISFVFSEKKIPLSKTYYKHLKNCIV